MKRLTCYFGMLAAMAFILACGPGKEAAPPTAGESTPKPVAVEETKAPAQKFLIGFSQSNNAEPWRETMNRAALAEAKKYPEIELRFTDGAGDNNTQIANTENLAAAGIKLLIISPNEAPALTPVVTRIYQQGIPVIVLDREIEGDAYSCFIGADNKEIGKAAGTYIAQILNGTGTVYEIQGRLAATPTTGRHEGFMEVINGFPGIKVIGQQEGLYFRDKAMELMENALQTTSDIDLVYAHNDEMAIGAYNVAMNRGVANKIKFVGVDGIPGPGRGVEAVQQGILAATFLYPNCGREAIENAVKILHGEQVEKRIRLNTATITIENAAQYSAM